MRNGALVSLGRGLDRLYAVFAGLGAVALIGILVMVVTQILSRQIDLGIMGTADYASFLMASSAALAFAHTFRTGGHIRVNLLIGKLGRTRRAVEILSFGFAAASAAFLAWYSARLVWFSHKLGDISQGLDATPLWIPQTGLAVGLALFSLAVTHSFLELIVTGSTAAQESAGEISQSE
jgi:TRAP-type C4-dicarboxylate transport system permease small subunit